MAGHLAMWVITDHPKDVPDAYVARRWVIHAGGYAPTHEWVSHAELDALREMMRQKGLTLIPRFPNDDPVIVETWV